MSETEDGVPMTLVIVALRGRDKGRFGWILRCAGEFALQRLKKFDSEADARADYAAFEREGAAVH